MSSRFPLRNHKYQHTSTTRLFILLMKLGVYKPVNPLRLTVQPVMT